MFTPGLSRRRLAYLTALAACVAVFHGTPARAQDSLVVRIGWQPTTTVEAQIAHVLQRTDILQRNGFKGEFIMFSFGPAVNEALISGAVDVGFIGDMPSVSLAAVNAPITVIGRQSVFRGAIVASTKSDIKTVQDLKGKKLHGPIGSSIYLAALEMLDKANLRPGIDVEVTNMGFADLSDAVRAGKIDAAFVWDPWVENFRKGAGSGNCRGHQAHHGHPDAARSRRRILTRRSAFFVLIRKLCSMQLRTRIRQTHGLGNPKSPDN